ncbi:hypothetical protein Tsubulata_047589 [Turnera subulata]|uniref:Water stress and hypersensitive response domain-containing protein n=1 Tax=Turnera subulata TaxID=218843 RepID=A0A9Q0JJ95_9ROSI|nr:hypothetical protein Tsubulata_047589 [Turnera subulata]
MMGTPMGMGMGSTGMGMGSMDSTGMGMGSPLVTPMGLGPLALMIHASITGFDISLHRDSIEYNVKISMTTPTLNLMTNPVLSVALSHVVKSAGREIASGTKPADGRYITANTTTVLDVPLKVPCSGIPAVSDIDYELELVLGFDFGFGGKPTIPFKMNGQIKLDPAHP